MKDSDQTWQYTIEKRSMTETLLETLTQGGLRPALERPASRNRRRGWIAGGLIALSAVALGAALVPAPSPPAPEDREPVAVLRMARGSVKMASTADPGDASMLALAVGRPIHAGTVIDTSGNGIPSGRAALTLAGGPSLRLDKDTRVRIASGSVVILRRGAVYLDSAAARAGVEVRTTLGVVRDVGTQFEVRVDDEGLRVRVREGEVVVERHSGVHQAAAGEELVMAADGTVTRGSIPSHGPLWDWVVEVVPIPDFDGRPLSAFLDWVAREGGWNLSFADDETAELASTTLNGDLGNLTLEEATEVVFRGTKLEYRIEDDGTFYVGPLGAGE